MRCAQCLWKTTSALRPNSLNKNGGLFLLSRSLISSRGRVRIEVRALRVRSLGVKHSYSLQARTRLRTKQTRVEARPLVAARRRTQQRGQNKTPAYKRGFRLLLRQWEGKTHINRPQHPTAAAVQLSFEESRTSSQGHAGVVLAASSRRFQVGVTLPFPTTALSHLLFLG